MKCFDIFLILFIVLNFKKVQAGRNKRTLVYPGPIAKVQAIMGAGFPVDLEDETSIVGIVIKSQHFLPKNSTDYTNPNTVFARKRRSYTNSATRWDIYKILEQYASIYGFGGKGCILRTICDLAQNPISTTGLIEEIIHTVFTPTTTNDVMHNHSDNEYYAAQKIGGEIKGECGRLFPDCKASFVDMFTIYLNHK